MGVVDRTGITRGNLREGIIQASMLSSRWFGVGRRGGVLSRSRRGLGFRVQGLGFKVSGLGFRV